MDKAKIGKFLAKCRKEKKLTQKELSDLLNIGEKTVSKWERGINSPDISILLDLSEIFSISVNEILSGEKKELKNENIESLKLDENKITIESIKHYNNISKLKYLKIFGTILGLILILIVSVFTINNYNKFHVYDINSVNEEFEISGYVIFNNYRNFIILDNISQNNEFTGTDKEVFVKSANISLINDNTILMSKGDIYYEFEEELSLNEYLNNATIFINENSETLSKELKTSDLQNLKLQITYINKKNKEEKILIPLETKKEYSNNRIFS